MSYYTERDEILGDIEQAERDFAGRPIDPVVEEAREIARAQVNDERRWREFLWLARMNVGGSHADR